MGSTARRQIRCEQHGHH